METDSDKYHAFRGVRKTEDGAMFGFALPSEYRQARRWRPETPAYLLLFRRDEEKPFCRIRLDSHIKQGTYSCIRIRDPELSACRYAYEVDGNIVPDPYGTSFTGCSCFGEAESGTVTSSLSFLKDPETFDWKGDRHPRTPFDDSVFYKLHVRGFTKSETSGVPEEERGTFAGLIRKIPHIVSLGVTAVELMPAYEFDECRRLTSGGLQKNLAGVQQEKPQLNFWGYVPAFGYFAPKAAYCASTAWPLENTQRSRRGSFGSANTFMCLKYSAATTSMMELLPPRWPTFPGGIISIRLPRSVAAILLSSRISVSEYAISFTPWCQ